MAISVVCVYFQVNENKLAARSSLDRWVEVEEKKQTSTSQPRNTAANDDGGGSSKRRVHSVNVNIPLTLIKSESYVTFMCQAIYLFIVSTA